MLGFHGAVDHVLYEVIGTPHVAWFSRESVVEMRQTAATVVKRHLGGHAVRNVVNRASLAS